jgi:hypothetical protein
LRNEKSAFTNSGIIVTATVTLLACSHFNYGLKGVETNSIAQLKDKQLKDLPRVPAQEVLSSILGLGATEKMDMERLKLEAFQRCQGEFVKPVITPVPVLDPPQSGGPDQVGMIFQEELSVRTQNLLDRDDFYFSPRPRAAVNTLPMEIFVDADNSGSFIRKTWDDANPDFTSSIIQPPIDKNTLPPAGRVLTEMIIGHKAPAGGYPQLFDIRSSAYVRFAGYPPQVTGASMRLGAHKIFSKGGKDENAAHEDFPIIRALFVSVPNLKTARALVLLESQLFCGALSLDMTEGENAAITVDNYFFTREDYRWKKDPHTAFVAYSSMLWKTEKQTPERDSDEAHDSDMLTVKFADNTESKYRLDPPADGIAVKDFGGKRIGKKIAEWILANEDRDPAHYADFEPALGTTNYDKRVSYSVKILESNIRTSVTVYEQATGAEYADNIVAASTIRQDIKKAKSPQDAAHFKYRTTAFYP